MARGPEAKVKDWLDRELKKVWPNHWRYKVPGGRFGRVGVPDFIMCVHGLFIAIEVKAEGKSPTKMQDTELKLISVAGGIRCVIRGKNEVVFNKLVTLVNKRGNSLKKAIQVSK